MLDKCVYRSAGQTLSQELHAQQRVRCEPTRPGGHSFSRSPSVFRWTEGDCHDARYMICEPPSLDPVREWAFQTCPDVRVSLQFAVIAGL